ncbi:hypothetical protein AcV5_002867 [Taiwanofungus camphoratus]|nr:hypothetical protein AcV5_002867 [Antrodia cinnamomea]
MVEAAIYCAPFPAPRFQNIFPQTIIPWKAVHHSGILKFNVIIFIVDKDTSRSGITHDGVKESSHQYRRK